MSRRLLQQYKVKRRSCGILDSAQRRPDMDSHHEWQRRARWDLDRILEAQKEPHLHPYHRLYRCPFSISEDEETYVPQKPKAGTTPILRRDAKETQRHDSENNIVKR
ncbi:hypothetical protein Vi05172_g11752 [Venturia inaequalis]|nr:hypothetical protein Vi05172_g11752 [Venturia inaequalis]